MELFQKIILGILHSVCLDLDPNYKRDKAWVISRRQKSPQAWKELKVHSMFIKPMVYSKIQILSSLLSTSVYFDK